MSRTVTGIIIAGRIWTIDYIAGKDCDLSNVCDGAYDHFNNMETRFLVVYRQ